MFKSWWSRVLNFKEPHGQKAEILDLPTVPTHLPRFATSWPNNDKSEIIDYWSQFPHFHTALLIIFFFLLSEPVTLLNHTLMGSSSVIKLGDTMHGSCYADGDPPPVMKIIYNNTGEIIMEGRTNNLSYSVVIKQHQRQVTFVCEAKNNPEKMPVSQVLRVDVNCKYISWPKIKHQKLQFQGFFVLKSRNDLCYSS